MEPMSLYAEEFVTRKKNMASGRRHSCGSVEHAGRTEPDFVQIIALLDLHAGGKHA
jgi:hypothetical protein